MSTTDHAAEAIRLVDMADRSYGQIEHRNGDMAISQQIEAQTLAATAQVHATLHLAEQQRIANLLTAFTTYERWPSRAAATSFSAVKEALAAELREAMGVS